MPKIPPVTLALLVANILVFLLQSAGGESMLVHFALWPLGPSQPAQLDNGSVVQVAFQPWQILSYSFLHGGFAHIAFNMFALWMFGAPVETALGSRRFTFFYFACVIGAACAQLAVIALFQPDHFYPTVGASGGVFGLLLAFAMFYPQARLAFIFIPIPVPAPIFVIGYMIIELFLGITGSQAGVAHFAHLGGAVVGFVLIQYWRSQGRSPRS
ncbi:MAG TPA: rhomboid family intramembrane serine protease [Rudaea sp.]|jgi:membrane associated rhomboid family serine protease